MLAWRGSAKTKTVGAVAATLACALTLAACSSSGNKSSGSTGGTSGGGASSSSSGPLTNISIVGSYNGDFGLAEIAQQAGFFKAQGLNAKLVNSAGFSSANLQSAFLSGQYTFEIGAAPSEMLAIVAGGKFHAVMAMDLGQQQQIAIDGGVASKHNIPNPGASATEAQTEAQLAALKGTGISIGTSNKSSPSYNQMAATFAKYGISTKSDVSIKFLGNTSALPPAMAAGKVDAFSVPPPVSDVKGATVINLGNVEPVHSATSLYMMALDSTISGKSDTVQKTINAMVQAWNFAKTNPTQAEPMLGDVYDAYKLKATDAEAQVLYTDDARYWVTPDMPQSGFTNALNILETGQGSNVNLTYDQMVNDTFVQKAASTLNITLPTIS
jgi:ABC-type nitrate/sulfonate/bicarbonate transport system substrate-binding protein